MTLKIWTEEKIKQLSHLVVKGYTKKEISNFFNVTVPAVEHAISRYVSVKKGSKKHTNKVIVEEVRKYVEHIKETTKNYNDPYKKVKLVGPWRGDRQSEDQILLLSDMHTGMINKAPHTGEVTYNQEIQEAELTELMRGIGRFHQLYAPSYNIETFYIFGLGDLITNDRIFEGQKSEITCGVGRQIQLAFQYVSDAIKRLLEIYPRVVYVNVVGNHGRTTSKYMSEDATDNFEYLLGTRRLVIYQIPPLQLVFGKSLWIGECGK